MVYGQVARPEAVGPIEHRPWAENTYAIPHGDGSSFRDIAASNGTAQAHPARLGRLCLNASLLRGRRMMLCATASRSQKSKHDSRRVLTRATTPLEWPKAEDGRCGRKACRQFPLARAGPPPVLLCYSTAVASGLPRFWRERTIGSRM